MRAHHTEACSPRFFLRTHHTVDFTPRYSVPNTPYGNFLSEVLCSSTELSLRVIPFRTNYTVACSPRYYSSSCKYTEAALRVIICSAKGEHDPSTQFGAYGVQKSKIINFYGPSFGQICSAPVVLSGNTVACTSSYVVHASSSSPRSPSIISAAPMQCCLSGAHLATCGGHPRCSARPKFRRTHA